MSSTVQKPGSLHVYRPELLEAETRRRMAGEGSGDVPFRSATPEFVPWREHVLHAVAVATLAYGVYYLAWRWTATLNPAALWISIPLAAAETVTFLTTLFLVINVWTLRKRQPRPAPRGLTADVFITTYNEPIDVIRKTARAARGITYPHRTYILDDGRRIDVARLARELGVGYITRPDNRNAKAGNLNNALGLTHGDFVLQLDADHVPLPHILDRLLGYMTDPEIAFVQAPQRFYNLDAFATHLDVMTRRFLDDQDMFFSVIQPGKDRFNAAFFCGSCAVLRRSAIEGIGGFSTRTITEDIETSLLLHAKGWKSIYHNEPLAWGLAPRTASGYHLQRLRWARGGMQLLRRFNPLFVRGLSGLQRLSYFSSVLHPLDGPVRIVYFATPLIFLATGVYPVRSFGIDFLAHFAPYLIGLLTLHRLLSRGRAGPFWFLDFSAVARMFSQTLALSALFTNRQLRFRVTPKGAESVSRMTHLPHVLTVVASAAAIGVGATAFLADRLWNGSGSVDGPAVLVNAGWALWNAVIAAMVVKASIASQERRPSHRFEEYLPFRYRPMGADGKPGPDVTAITEDINATGLAFRTLVPLDVSSTISLSLPLQVGTVAVKARVLHCRSEQMGRVRVYRHGARFEDIPPAARDAIDLHCTQHAVPASRARRVESIDPFREFGRWFHEPRRGERLPVRLPVSVRIGEADTEFDDGGSLAVLEGTSSGGASMVSETMIPRGTWVSWTIPGTLISGRGKVVRVESIRTPLGERYVLGLATDRDTKDAINYGTGRRVAPMKKAAMIAGLLTALKRFGIVGLIAGSLLGAGTGTALGQVGGGLLAGAETAEGGQSLILAGGWLNGSSGAWRPLAGILGYRLGYNDGGKDVVAWTANPYAGLRRQWSDAGLQLTVGYAFQNDDADGTVSRQITSDLTVGALFDYGNAGPTFLQAIGSWSAGDGGYLWSRLRVAERVASTGAGPFRAGVEATAQGGDLYHAYEVGPILVWPVGTGKTFVLGGGYRRAEPDGSAASNHGYVRFELVLIPGA